jgi:UDP-N-acetylglucosamine diphosphorylase/glucosamine-1-phosphate N-acetyltransferase
MQIVFDDHRLHKALAPLTLTRPVAEIRVGILTIRETWVKMLEPNFENLSIAYITEAYLNKKFPVHKAAEDFIIINGSIKPSKEIAAAVGALTTGQTLNVNGIFIAAYGKNSSNRIDLTVNELVRIEKPWHVFQLNHLAISIDFELLTAGKTSQPLSATNQVINPSNVFLEAGAKVECAVLNASTGPIYIGKDTEIMEGSLIRGPFAMTEGAVVKMGAKIYGATTIGDHCKVGGEISNCIFQAYSNKGHDGFLGNSLVGEWCNFGADTNSSNLKNNYSPVKIYSYETNKLEQTNVQFCGVIMGDHSKTGINTMLNTATVVGVHANIFGGGFPPKFIPSFSWGGFEDSERFELEKAYEVAENMMSRRHLELSDFDKEIFNFLNDNLAQ